jgi:twitching motility protein PilI
MNGEDLIGALREIERRCRKHAVGLPQQERPPEIWAGVLFSVGDGSFLAPLADVAELLEVPRDITRVPGAKPWVSGVANNRGTLLPIFDLQAFLLGVPTPRTPRNRVLVVRQRELPFGLLVSEVVGIRHFEVSTRAAQAPTLSGGVDELVSGSFAKRGERFPVLDLCRLGLDTRFNLAAA